MKPATEDTQEVKMAKLTMAITYALGALSDIAGEDGFSFSGKTAQNALNKIETLVGVTKS